MNRKWLTGSLVAAILLVPPAIQWARGSDGAHVDSSPVDRHELKPTVLASGTLTYRSQVTLTPEILGRVREIRVSEGSHVRKGEIVLRLDADAYRAEVSQYAAAASQAQLAIERTGYNRDYQQARLARYERLRALGMVTALQYDELKYQAQAASVDLDDARKALARARAQLAQASERLAKTEIASPMDGIVTSVGIRLGETAVPSVTGVPGSELMTISDTGGRYAEVNVDEADVDKLARGQPASVFAASSPDVPIAAVVDEISISPKARPEGKSYLVKLRLEGSPDGGPRTGMSCRAEILTGRRERVVAVPQQALLGGEEGGAGRKGGSYVLVVEDGVARRRDVETGISDDSYVEIRRGLAPREQLITGPARTLRLLRDGERVALQAARRESYDRAVANR
jgi:HlyD family secretion protein